MMYTRLTTRFAIGALLTTAAILVFAAAIQAVPPSPEAVEQWKSQGILDQKLAEWRAADPPHTLGPNTTSLDVDKIRQATAAGLEPLPETTKVLIVLVDFDNLQHKIEPSRFDSLLLSNRNTGPVVNPTGSMTDFYLENSYGHYYVKGQVIGWFRMSEPYDYYWDRPDYLAHEAADSATRVVDFRDFDLDGDQIFTELLVVHAGAGAETGAAGIWSHMSSLPGSVIHDHVRIASYTMNPELYGGGISTIGVFTHEYGHILGMPDLYDVDYEPPGSSGLGDWSLMAGGSWNGPGGNTPAHFDAYCKYQLGLVTPIVLDADPSVPGSVQSIIQAPIPQVESEPVVYYMSNDTAIWGWWEFWLVENRQKVGFDAALPGEGLCIYHVDRNVYDNSDPLRYHVALEQADGKNALALGGSGSEGDAGDPYPGTTNNRNFTVFTNPNSYTNFGEESRIGVWNISDSDSLMFADLETIYTHPYLLLWDDDPLQFTDTLNGGNGDGFLDPGETIEFHGYVKNVMAQSFHPMASLSVDNPSVTFIQNDVPMNIVSLNPSYPPQYNAQPIIFTIAPDADPANVVFTFSVASSPSMDTSVERAFVSNFEFDGVIGKPGVLIVDDDGGQEWQQNVIRSVQRAGLAYGMWDKNTLGSPTAADLLAYPSVLWHTGTPENGGTLTIPDVYAMQVFLDGGGNLFLSSMSGAQTLNSIAPTFLSNYLHCTLDSTGLYAEHMDGIDGNEIGDGLSLVFDYTTFSRSFDILQPANGGEAAFEFMFSIYHKGIGAVSFANETYKTFFTTFPVEFVEDDPAESYYDPVDSLMLRVFRTFGGIATDVADDGHTDVLPKNFALQQNYPNPFNPSTEIAYTLSPTADGKLPRTTLSIFNVLGQKVKTLVDEVQSAGSYRVTWDGRTDTGQRVSSGVYFYRLTRGEEAAARKMVLLK